MPMLPEKTEQPANHKADGGSNARRFDHIPHVRPQAARGSEAPNAAHDEQPAVGTAGKGGKYGRANGHSSGEIVASGLIVRFRASWAGTKQEQWMSPPHRVPTAYRTPGSQNAQVGDKR
jgi:hypothetical protein